MYLFVNYIKVRSLGKFVYYMEIAIQSQILHNNHTQTIGRFLGNIQNQLQTRPPFSIDSKFVMKFLFNILLFPTNCNTNQVCRSNFPVWSSLLGLVTSTSPFTSSPKIPVKRPITLLRSSQYPSPSSSNHNVSKCEHAANSEVSSV